MQNTKQIFWKYFWYTIAVLLLMYITALVYISLENSNKNSLSQKRSTLSEETNGSITIAPEFFKMLEKQLPLIDNDISSELNKTEHKIYANIDREVDVLFEPVNQQIPKYADFHYSLTGEYLEIGSALSGNLASSIKEKLFDTVDFDAKYNMVLNTIQSNSQSFISETTAIVNEKSKNRLNLSTDEMKIFNKVSTLSIEDSMARFDDISSNIIRAGALGTGAKFSTVVIAKVMGKKIATTVLAKAAAKGGAKIVGIGGGAAAGAAVGSVVPGVGTVVGGVVGAVAAWLAVDKVIIEMDEVFNREEFEKDLKTLIAKQKENMKIEIKSAYAKSLSFFSKDLQERYGKLKLKDIINSK